jgi:hypothetical protein
MPRSKRLLSFNRKEINKTKRNSKKSKKKKKEKKDEEKSI